MTKWLLAIRNVIEKRLLVFTRDMNDDTFWFKNYFIAFVQYYHKGATRNTDTIKLVQISDTHLRCIGPGLIKAVKKVNALKPDIILFTGDMVNGNSYLPLFETFMNMLDREVPKIAITGNWEYHEKIDLDALRAIYAKGNCELLINETRQFIFKNRKVSITGIDDFSQGHADYVAAVKEYKPSDYHIVLTHCPAHYDVILTQLTPEVPVDFILSGHTHGGQINIFGFIPFLPACSANYVKDWCGETEPKMYVSQGIGTSIFPIRLGSRAEIGVFHLPAKA